MKILYAIQGTGNGHISRARDIIPILLEKGELDILVSGIQADVQLNYPVKYKMNGLSFVFGKTGGIDLWQTFKRSNLRQLYKDIQSFPIQQYDLVINDFEPISAWACKLNKKKCIGLSHQAAVSNIHSPKPEQSDFVGKYILQHYAPVHCAYSFHFQSYDKNIFTPIIRKHIRNLTAITGNHFTVYLPAYGDQLIINILSRIEGVYWEVFSKHSTTEIKIHNIHIRPINNDDFVNSMANSVGVLCGAGFETPAEALYLKKKLMVIPMLGQYEQQCNAAALQKMGVPVIDKLSIKNMEKIRNWTIDTDIIAVDYEDNARLVVELLIKEQL